MSGGYLANVLILGACVLLMVAPLPLWRPLAALSFWLGLLVNEQPHWFGLGLLIGTVTGVAAGGLGPIDWFVVALGVAVLAGLLWLLARAFPSRAVLRDAVAELDPEAVRRLSGPGPTAASLALPLGFGWTRFKRTGNISYGPVPGKWNRLDVYTPRRREVSGPTLIYLHGGRFRRGGKRREAQAMHGRLAGRGWCCISANYRLNPHGWFPDYLIDLKRVIAWARTEGREFGGGGPIFLAGGSAGAHIATMASLTANRPELQPGFEEVDTSVSGVIGLYGYYGGLNRAPDGAEPVISSAPSDHVRPGQAPFLFVHGSHDTVMSAAGARALVAELRAHGNAAALAELPGAQHSFDLLRSIRVDNTIDAIDDFAAWVRRA